MTSTNRPPGTWHIEEGHRICDSHGVLLADVRGAGILGNNVSDSNARLIAAAPELLEACKWMMQELCEAWEQTEEEAIPAKFRAAMATAKGGAA